MRQTGLILLILSALLFGTGCVVEPPSELQVQYAVTGLDYSAPNIEVTYWVKNSGEFDLENIQLFFEIDRDNSGDSYEIEGWSSSFDLNSGSSTTRTFYYQHLSGVNGLPEADPETRVIITKVGMDNPPDEN